MKLFLATALVLLAAAPAARADFGVTVGAPPVLGPLLPGQTGDYSGTVVASVVSTAASAQLTITDTGTDPGHLCNGTSCLPTALEVSATSTAPGATGSAFGPVGSALRTLVTYSAPISGTDDVTVGFRQHVAATDPLRSGTYAKTLVITLATTAP